MPKFSRRLASHQLEFGVEFDVEVDVDASGDATSPFGKVEVELPSTTPAALVARSFGDLAAAPAAKLATDFTVAKALPPRKLPSGVPAFLLPRGDNCSFTEGGIAAPGVSMNLRVSDSSSSTAVPAFGRRFFYPPL